MNDECVHHWRIERPQGPESKGVCKKCGAERLFSNSQYISAYEGNAAIYLGPKDPALSYKAFVDWGNNR